MPNRTSHIFRTIGAVVIIWFALNVLSIVFYTTMHMMAPRTFPASAGGAPTLIALVTLLVFDMALALAGGFIAAYVAERKPLEEVGVLAAVVLLFGLFYAWWSRETLPYAFLVLHAVGNAAAVVGGGFLFGRIYETVDEESSDDMDDDGEEDLVEDSAEDYVRR